jgi:hypothetical protein
MTKTEFLQTNEFAQFIDVVWRGMITGGNGVSYGETLDREEGYAANAGNIAYAASDGDVGAAYLAMALTAPLRHSTPKVFDAIKKLGVDATACDQLLYPNGDVAGEMISYRALWADSVNAAMIKNIGAMPKIAQIALLSHAVNVGTRLSDPVDPAPDFIKEKVQKLLTAMLPVADKVAPFIANIIRSSEGEELTPHRVRQALAVHRQPTQG